MKTQSVDTHPDTERMLVHLIRNAPISKRFRTVQSLTQSTLWAHMQVWCQQHSDTSEQETAVQIVKNCYGSALAAHVQIAMVQQQWHIQPVDLLTIILPILHICDEQNILCYIAGSIASSLHGMQQMAQDIDLVVDMHDQDLSCILPHLQQGYVFDEQVLRDAVHQRGVCSLIHLSTLMKVDLIITKQTACDYALREHLKLYQLDECFAPLRVASATEMILYKLHRYSQDLLSRTDGMRDDAQWNDIMGMLKVQEPILAYDLLECWAKALDILELLKQALLDAGVEREEAA